jgi:hypothetical protein
MMLAIASPRQTERCNPVHSGSLTTWLESENHISTFALGRNHYRASSL